MFKRFLDRVIKPFARFITFLAKKEVRDAGKVVTGETINSITPEITATSFFSPVTVELVADKSLQYIEDGRKPGGKFPVFKTANGYELFPRLDRWKKEVRFPGSDFQLAQTIAVKGIKPVPVITRSQDKIEGKLGRLEDELLDNADRELAGSFQEAVNRIRTIKIA